RRPATEGEFHHMLFILLRVLVALGFSVFLVHDFLAKVVYNTMQVCKESFKVAHELMLIYFRAIETDGTGAVHLGNVYDRGYGDTFLAEARLSAAAFFRPGGGNLLDDKPTDGKRKWSGKVTGVAKKPCTAFNFEKEHQPHVLDANGACRFTHTCSQWVSDKGPGGMCGGDHAKAHCTYDAAKKRDTALP
ncbi:MAG: hypothetical protein ACPIOQ_83845, partial [Promethearchaeia archaeon]